ncbi:MAG: hypothetical protein OEV58_16160 [Gammaproteobacteria bacterium]|jgi:hypothetical protein|nr:hypothetical protein [Gammaproteobacteria bacterium]MDH5261258.1 hypothetical protein [Gammaproteobacteria bacterium]
MNRLSTKSWELQNSVDNSSTREERNQVIVKIRALESRAFDLLVCEKLAANDSFRIFMTLATDIIAEMTEPGDHH